MADLNYHPNLNARSLVSSYTQVIGLVLPDDSDVFYQNPSSLLPYEEFLKLRQIIIMPSKSPQERMKNNV